MGSTKRGFEAEKSERNGQDGQRSGLESCQRRLGAEDGEFQGGRAPRKNPKLIDYLDVLGGFFSPLENNFKVN